MLPSPHPSSPGRDFDQVNLATEVVRVGTFRLGPEHPSFEDSGAIQEHIFVFPRTSCVIEHEGRSPFVTDTATVTYYNPGQRYCRGLRDPQGDRCEWFGVREDVVRAELARWDPAAADRPGERLFTFVRGLVDARTYLFQRQVVRHVTEGVSIDAMLVEEAVIGLLGQVLRQAHGKPQSVPDPGGRPGLAEEVRAVLAANVGRPLTLADVARAVDSSISNMCRTFRRATGTTIHSHLNLLRLQRGLEMVAEQGSDLSRVAFRLGFSSHSHFTATFRRTFGIPPSEFRRGASPRRISACQHWFRHIPARSTGR